SRRRHTRSKRDWSSDVCSSDLSMLQSHYKKRHDEVVRCLHFQYTKKYGLNKNKRLKNYKVEQVVSNERVKIKSDIPVVTELRIEIGRASCRERVKQRAREWRVG